MKPPEIKRLILRDIKDWRSMLDLDGWNLMVSWERHDSGMVASCRAEWEYREARLSFDPEQMADRDLDREEIRSTVLHELLHCCCNGYERWHEDYMLEEMVSHLTMVLLRCWRQPSKRVS